MKLILLSGGSGKRLWPISNDSRSKQFLKILEGSQNNYVSMIQRVWTQLSNTGLSKDSIIATNKPQVDMIRSQLGFDVPLVLEPERRDTFPAIALAITYLYSEKNVDLDEIVSISPVDPYVEDNFFHRMKDLESVLQKTGSNIGLMGVKPIYPSSKYGYIVPENIGGGEYFRVSHFKEKPNENLAKQLIDKKALWNSGVFALRIGYIIQFLLEKGFPVNYHELLEQYSYLPKNSFDYEVVEKEKEIIAIEYDGSWKDLGTWNTLTEEMSTNVIGKGLISKETKNNHILNELDIPITLIGLNNIVIAASPDGILVTDKQASPKVKEILKDVEQQRPMYEERIWGWYKVLDYNKYDNENEVLTKKIGINKNKNLSYHYHNSRNETWTIISGEGELIKDGQKSFVKAGDIINIPAQTMHAIKAIDNLEIIEVQAGIDINEYDVKRVCYEWNEIDIRNIN